MMSTRRISINTRKFREPLKILRNSQSFSEIVLPRGRSYARKLHYAMNYGFVNEAKLPIELRAIISFLIQANT